MKLQPLDLWLPLARRPRYREAGLRLPQIFSASGSAGPPASASDGRSLGATLGHGRLPQHAGQRLTGQWNKPGSLRGLAPSHGWALRWLRPPKLTTGGSSPIEDQHVLLGDARHSLPPRPGSAPPSCRPGVESANRFSLVGWMPQGPAGVPFRDCAAGHGHQVGFLLSTVCAVDLQVIEGALQPAFTRSRWRTRPTVAGPTKGSATAGGSLQSATKMRLGFAAGLAGRGYPSKGSSWVKGTR